MKLHRYVDHQRLHIVTKDVISLSISVLLLFRHYISHKITFGAPSSGGVLRSACGAFIFIKIHFINVSGQYKPDKGKELCQECEDGYYTTKEGTIECTECPAGYFCPVSIHSSPLRL